MYKNYLSVTIYIRNYVTSYVYKPLWLFVKKVIWATHKQREETNCAMIIEYNGMRLKVVNMFSYHLANILAQAQSGSPNYKQSFELACVNVFFK